MLTAHLRANYTRACKELANTSPASDNESTRGTSKQAIQSSYEAVRKVRLLLDSMQNPFSPSTELISLFSGVKATDVLVADLLQAHTKGQQACDEFVQKRLMTDTTEFHARLPRLGLKTFSSQLHSRVSHIAYFTFCSSCKIVRVHGSENQA